MNMLNETGSNVLRYPRLAEIALYGVLAAALIGAVLRQSTPLTTGEAVAVLAGALCGILAACGASPITALLRRRMVNADTPQTRTPSVAVNVSPFARREHGHARTAPHVADDSRRAA